MLTIKRTHLPSSDLYPDLGIFLNSRTESKFKIVVKSHLSCIEDLALGAVIVGTTESTEIYKVDKKLSEIVVRGIHCFKLFVNINEYINKYQIISHISAINKQGLLVTPVTEKMHKDPVNGDWIIPLQILKE